MRNSDLTECTLFYPQTAMTEKISCLQGNGIQKATSSNHINSTPS